jgi:uncharacterized membrane protein YkvA (DUF1232 family)
MNNKPARFDSFTKKAGALIQSPARVQKLTGQAVRKLAGRGADGFQEAKSQLQTAIAMINAWRGGDYEGASTKTMVILLAAVLYFVVPLDVIPDFFLGWGFIDDMAVMGYVFSQLTDEVEAFKTWQDANANQMDDETNDHG